MFHANGWGMPWATTAMGCPRWRCARSTAPRSSAGSNGTVSSLVCAAPAVVDAVLDALPDWDRPVPGRSRTRVVVAGAPPPSRTIERIESELEWEFLQIYGLTETSPLLTVNRRRSEWDDHPAAVRARKMMRAGAPAVGTELRVDGNGGGAGPQQYGDGGLLARSPTRPTRLWPTGGSIRVTAAPSTTRAI